MYVESGLIPQSANQNFIKYIKIMHDFATAIAQPTEPGLVIEKLLTLDSRSGNASLCLWKGLFTCISNWAQQSTRCDGLLWQKTC